MLKLILSVAFIMLKMCDKVESCVKNICECDKLTQDSDVCDYGLTGNFTSQCRLSEDQKIFLSALGYENLIFIDSFTVKIKISEVSSNFSEVNLSWIKKLSLMDNNLTDIPDLIVQFNKIDSLDLSRNKIEFIDTELFRTLDLKQLNLSYNSINSSSYLNLTNLLSLDLSNNNLTSMPNLQELPALQYLNLSNNRLEIFDSREFKFNSLQHLDVSSNHLHTIASIHFPNLIQLNVGGNAKLGTSSRDIFGTDKLQSLDASGTGLKQVPAALTRSIQFLKLSENWIETINRGDFDAYPLLRSLDLSFSGVEFVEEDSLGRLELLRDLYLTGNKISGIPKRLPEKLETLRLDRNEIGEIRKGDLLGLNELDALFLNDNNLTVINEGAFGELISLTELDLSQNPLINLPSGSFLGPSTLRRLHLSSVAIISANLDDSFPLSAPESLVSLDLSYSPGLARKFLSDTATVMAAKRLEHLDLSGTNLQDLRQDLQYFLPELKSLGVDGNHFNSTVINWVKSWLCQTKNRSLEASTAAGDNFTELAQNFNEVDEFSDNEVYYMTKFFQNKTPLEPNELQLVRLKNVDEVEIDKRNSIKWNISNGEISKYTSESEKKNYFYRSLFLVLSTAVVVFSISVFLILRLIKTRRSYVEDPEATALPTISDIW